MTFKCNRLSEELCDYYKINSNIDRDYVKTEISYFFEEIHLYCNKFKSPRSVFNFFKDSIDDDFKKIRKIIEQKSDMFVENLNQYSDVDEFFYLDLKIDVLHKIYLYFYTHVGGLPAIFMSSLKLDNYAKTMFKHIANDKDKYHIFKQTINLHCAKLNDFANKILELIVLYPVIAEKALKLIPSRFATEDSINSGEILYIEQHALILFEALTHNMNNNRMAAVSINPDKLSYEMRDFVKLLLKNNPSEKLSQLLRVIINFDNIVIDQIWIDTVSALVDFDNQLENKTRVFIALNYAICSLQDILSSLGNLSWEKSLAENLQLIIDNLQDATASDASVVAAENCEQLRSQMNFAPNTILVAKLHDIYNLIFQIASASININNDPLKELINACYNVNYEGKLYYSMLQSGGLDVNQTIILALTLTQLSMKLNYDVVLCNPLRSITNQSTIDNIIICENVVLHYLNWNLHWLELKTIDKDLIAQDEVLLSSRAMRCKLKA